MFKNQSSFNELPKEISQKNNPIGEEAPIRTMAEDLKDPDGSLAKASISQENYIKKNTNQNLTEKQKSSPFLSTPGTPEFSQKQPMENFQKNPVLKTNEAPNMHIEENSNKGTVLAIIIAFFIILIAGVGTYYFMTTRKTEMPEISEEPIETSELIQDEELETGIKEDFSETMPNYLVIDTAVIDQASFKELLSKKSETIISAGASAPVEFIVTDGQNNPLGFADFAKMTSIELSKDIMENLDKNFSLFILNDSSAPGIAIAIEALDAASIKTKLLRDEPLLSSQLGAILLSEYEPSTAPFGDHKYKGQAIRYQNLISPQKLAIDYAITETQLIFATTKVTMESIIDKLSSENTPQSENDPE